MSSTPFDAMTKPDLPIAGAIILTPAVFACRPPYIRPPGLLPVMDNLEIYPSVLDYKHGCAS